MLFCLGWMKVLPITCWKILHSPLKLSGVLCVLNIDFIFSSNLMAIWNIKTNKVPLSFLCTMHFTSLKSLRNFSTPFWVVSVTESITKPIWHEASFRAEPQLWAPALTGGGIPQPQEFLGPSILYFHTGVCHIQLRGPLRAPWDLWFTYSYSYIFLTCLLCPIFPPSFVGLISLILASYFRL